MGIDKMSLEFLLDVRKMGIGLGDTVTLGRQDLLVEHKTIENLFRRYDVPFTENVISGFYTLKDQFAEPMLEHLGSTKCASIDKSGFENASIVHDLNEPISREYYGQFDTVIDGGTLEHVFNFPQAIKSCMELTKVGGHVISITPSNNQLGHGFYQFSPELMFRVFSEENGFKIRKMIYSEHNTDNLWYEVLDPEIVSQRVQTKSIYAGSLMLLAEKIKNEDIFKNIPQQSDYAKEWEFSPDKGSSTDRLHFWSGQKTPVQTSPVAKAKGLLMAPLKKAKRDLIRKFFLQKNELTPDPRFFVPYPKPD